MAVAIKLDTADIIEDAKIGLTVVAPTPIRAHIAEDYLKGKPFTDDVLAEAAAWPRHPIVAPPGTACVARDGTGKTWCAY